MRRFWRWLWSGYYSDTAKCAECGTIASKTRMVYEAPYGWFCNNAEFASHWRRDQAPGA
jgi:hypothetical protein